jgi:hypothetical protein
MTSDRARASRWRSLISALSGRDERFAALDRAVLKLAAAQRDNATLLQSRLDDIARGLEQQPTAKDLREVRQALRSLTPEADDRRLFESIDQIAASGRPIVIGPWTGEVGFELLYWIPFLEWIRAHWGLAADREIVVSRGGVASWYGPSCDRYVDVFSSTTPDEYSAATTAEKRKHRQLGAFDERLIESAVRERGVHRDDVDVLHPGLMFRAFAPYWSDDAGYGRIDRFTRYRLLTSSFGDRPAGLPENYVAVRFYFSECFPASAENRAFAQSVVSSLARHSNVVMLNPGFSVDDHRDWAPTLAGRVTSIADGLTPERNLAVQSAVIGGARAFVGTYGGYAYLAPLYRVPALAFFSRPTYKLHHLHTAQRAFGQLGAGALTLIDAGQADLVQFALGAVAAA